MNTTDATWTRVIALAGTDFSTKTGKKFSYDIVGNSVALRNTNRMIPRSHIEQAAARAPLTGPGQLQDLQGPSYVFAIVTDPRVRGTAPLSGGGDVAEPLPPSPDLVHQSSRTKLPDTTLSAPLVEAGEQEMTMEKSSTLSHGKPGTPVTEQDLASLGFQSFELQFLYPVPLPLGTGTNWNTLGKIPSGPGLYAFTTEIPHTRDTLRVRYVGMTTDLWMVTKGQLPGGMARGGQRYGRPKHAGETRKRINIEVTTARAEGLHVQHWLRPVDVQERADVRAALLQEEARLIEVWNLRSVGWNRA